MFPDEGLIEVMKALQVGGRSTGDGRQWEIFLFLEDPGAIGTGTTGSIFEDLDCVSVGMFEDIFPVDDPGPEIVDGRGKLVGTEITWTNETGDVATIYGWGMQSQESDAIVNARAFEAPVEVADGTDFLFTPKLFDDDLSVEEEEEEEGGGGGIEGALLASKFQAAMFPADDHFFVGDEFGLYALRISLFNYAHEDITTEVGTIIAGNDVRITGRTSATVLDVHINVAFGGGYFDTPSVDPTGFIENEICDFEILP